MSATEKTLILCIDGDDDIGNKADVKTPVIGRDENLRAATQLAVSDPEEADSNAMFGAVKLHDRLRKEYPDESFEVATIAGTSSGGVEADRKMIKELGETLKAYDASGVILVTDGFADDALIPIVQSRVPITSIHHIVVKHSERIEETWAVFFRYLRMLVEDPYYSRVSLGVPGVLLVIFGFLLASGQVENAGMVTAFVLGIVLFMKGFNLDERIVALRPRLPQSNRLITVIAGGMGVILSLLGFYQGIIYAWKFLPEEVAPFWDLAFWARHLPDLVGNLLIRGIDLIILGAAIALIGDSASHYLQKKNVKIWENVVGLLFLFWIRLIILESAEILINPEITLTLFSPLIYYTIAGVASIILVVALIYRKYGREFFSYPLRQEG